MPTVGISLEIPMGHRLMHHPDKCRWPHGHNYRIDVTIRGPLNEEGMVLDFSEVKARLTEFFSLFDHAFCLFEGDPFLQDLKALRNAASVRVPTKVVVISNHPTAEVLAGLWQAEILTRLHWHAKVTVGETRHCFALPDPDYSTEPARIIEAW